jgi:hypothetical protein
MINILQYILKGKCDEVRETATGPPMHASRRSEPKDRSDFVDPRYRLLKPEIPLKVLIPELD